MNEDPDESRGVFALSIKEDSYFVSMSSLLFLLTVMYSFWFLGTVMGFSFTCWILLLMSPGLCFFFNISADSFIQLAGTDYANGF